MGTARYRATVIPPSVREAVEAVQTLVQGSGVVGSPGLSSTNHVYNTRWPDERPDRWCVVRKLVRPIEPAHTDKWRFVIVQVMASLSEKVANAESDPTAAAIKWHEYFHKAVHAAVVGQRPSITTGTLALDIALHSDENIEPEFDAEMREWHSLSEYELVLQP